MFQVRAVLVCVWFLACRVAIAADTSETFDEGPSNLEMYVGTEGLGKTAAETALYEDVLLGWGLRSRLSFFLGFHSGANGYLADGSVDMCTGIFGTPLDTDHFDMDLFAAFLLEGMSQFIASPMVELNFDLRPDLALWGIYLRGGFPMTGYLLENDAGSLEVDSAEYEFSVVAELLVGSYLTVGVGHMIHVEYNMTFPFSPMRGERAMEVGGIALGYNVELHERIELINQVSLDMPVGNEVISFGAMVGMIASIL